MRGMYTATRPDPAPRARCVTCVTHRCAPRHIQAETHVTLGSVTNDTRSCDARHVEPVPGCTMMASRSSAPEGAEGRRGHGGEEDHPEGAREDGVQLFEDSGGTGQQVEEAAQAHALEEERGDEDLASCRARSGPA